jgi:hypothetical protein
MMERRELNQEIKYLMVDLSESSLGGGVLRRSRQ